MKKLALILGLSFLLLVDGQIVTLMINVLPDNFELVSHLFLLFMIVLARQLSFWQNIIVFALFGLVYDAYYLNLLGVATVLYPFFAIVLNQVFSTLNLKLLNLMLVQLVMVFVFDLVSYLISWRLGLGGLRFDFFVVQILTPSIIFNLVVALLLYPLFMKISRKTRHKIVTSM